MKLLAGLLLAAISVVAANNYFSSGFPESRPELYVFEGIQLANDAKHMKYQLDQYNPMSGHIDPKSRIKTLNSKHIELAYIKRENAIKSARNLVSQKKANTKDICLIMYPVHIETYSDILNEFDELTAGKTISDSAADEKGLDWLLAELIRRLQARFEQYQTQCTPYINR